MLEIDSYKITLTQSRWLTLELVSNNLCNHDKEIGSPKKPPALQQKLLRNNLKASTKNTSLALYNMTKI